VKIMSDAANNLSAANAADSVKTVVAPVKKRAVRRCQLVASAEVTERDSQTKISARVSEIGLGGCYVDTLSPFPDGTLVHIGIIRDGGAFECEAKVVYVHESMGMGIAFTNIALDQRRLLENWIVGLITPSK
jgi:PilZ domain